MAERTVSVALQAKVSGFVTGMKTASKAASDFNSKLLSAADKNSQHLNTLSSTLGVAGGAMAGLAVLAVKSFADFDSAMSRVQAATHASAQDMSLLREAALEAGADTAFSATEAASAIEELSKAGIDTADVLNGGLDGALSLAAAGSLAVGDAAEIAATAMTQFGLSGDAVPHVADLLAAAAGKAQGSVSDMGMALKQGGLVASQMGWSIEETTGVLAEFASAGLLGSDAGTSLKTMLLQLVNPSEEAAGTMKRLGINAYDASGNFVGAEALAGQLRDRMSELNPATRNAALATIFGSDAIRAASILYKDGAQGVADWTNKVNDQGYAAETASLKMDNLSGDLEKLKGAFDNALIGLGEGANGPLRSLTQGLTDAVDGFNDMDPAAKSAVLAIVGGGGLAVLGVAGVLKLVTVLGEASVAAKALGLTAARAATFLKFAGVVGAVVGITAVVDHLGDSFNGINVEADKLSKGLDTWAESGKLVGDTANFMGGPLRDVIGDFANLDFALDNLGDQNPEEKFRSWADGVLPFSQATDDARKQIGTLDEALAKMVTSGSSKSAAEAFKMITERAKAQGVSVAQLKQLFPEYSGALKTNAEQQKATADEAKASAEKYKAQEDKVLSAADALKQMEERASGLNDTLGILNSTLDNLDAESAYEQSIDDLSARLKAYREESKKGEAGTKNMSAAFDLSEQAGRDNASALRDLWTRSSEYAVQTLETTGNQKLANQRLSEGRAQLVGMATQFLGSKGAAEKYVTEVLGIPKDVKSQWNTPGLSDALAKAHGLSGQANSLDGRVVNTYFKTKFTEIHERITSNKVFGSPGKMATGGRVSGPGSGTSDDVPMWLSNGEFVVSAQAAARNLALLERINSGFAPTGERLNLGDVKAGRGRPVMTSAVHASADTRQHEGDTINVAMYPRSVDINERNLQSVTHAARLRARVGRPR